MSIPNRKRRWCDVCGLGAKDLAMQEWRNRRSQQAKADELRKAVERKTRR